MSTCSNITAGYPMPQCILAASGIKAIYIKNFSAATLTNATISATTNVITYINSGETFYRFDLIPDTCEYNTTAPTSVQNASQVYETLVDLFIANSNPTLRNQILAMASGPTNIIVETRASTSGLAQTNTTDGDFYFIGGTLGCWPSLVKQSFGKLGTDARGWTIQFKAIGEAVAPYHVANSAAFTHTY